MHRKHLPFDTDVTRSQLLLIDFDHTMIAANSTELYIAFCKPMLIVSIIEFLVRGAIPWGIVPVKRRYSLRDYLCVFIITAVTPWNLLLWRREGPSLFRKILSTDVSQFINAFDQSKGCDCVFWDAFRDKIASQKQHLRKHQISSHAFSCRYW